MSNVYLCGPAFHLPGEPIRNKAIESHLQPDSEVFHFRLDTP